MKIGDKVVCIDDSPCCRCGAKNIYISKGMVYVVANVRLSILENPIIDLIGIKPPECHTKNQGFCINRFRLLDELKEESKQKADKELARKIPLWASDGD